jgi:hypothetical protein
MNGYEMTRWFVRGCVAAFALWTMSMPGTECYIAPHYWLCGVAMWLFCTRDC